MGLSYKQLLALWHSDGSDHLNTFRDVYYDLRKRFDSKGLCTFNKYEGTLFRDLRTEFGQQRDGHFAKDSPAAYLTFCSKQHRTPSPLVIANLNHEPGNATCEQILYGVPSTFRINGRATQTEEQHLRSGERKEFVAKVKSGKHIVDGKTLTPKAMFKKLAARGWSALDKDEKALFDDLTSVYAVIDNKDSQAAADFKSNEDNLDSCYLSPRAPYDKDRTESVHYQLLAARKLGQNVTVLGDSVSQWKCCSGGVWHDAFSTTVLLSSPRYHRAIYNEWERKHPETDFPESKIISDEWEKPKKESTKHADIPDEVKPVLLDYYRAHRDSNEQLQTNFFYGDNDNAPVEKSGAFVQPHEVACEWETRPSPEEVVKAARTGVTYNTLPAFTDSRGNQRPEMIVPVDGPGVVRDTDIRTVSDIERCAAFDERVERMNAAKMSDKYVEQNRPSFSPPIRKLGNVLLATSDFDGTAGSKRRGELLALASDKGAEYRPRDGIRGSKIVLPAAQLKQNRSAEAFRYACLCRDNGVDPNEVMHLGDDGIHVPTSHVMELSKDDRARQLANKVKQARAFWLTGTAITPAPAFRTASVTLDAAQAKYGVTPSNDNRVYSGLPWVLWRPEYVATKSGAGSPLLVDSPEDFLIEKLSRKLIEATKAELGPEKVLVLDSFLSSESFAVLGSKTGDEGKHERTQERNGKRRFIEVATEFSEISARIAA
jgi:hypothetical protein